MSPLHTQLRRFAAAAVFSLCLAPVAASAAQFDEGDFDPSSRLDLMTSLAGGPEGTALAEGPIWRARFDGEGMHMQPALGRRVREVQHLSLSAEGWWREGAAGSFAESSPRVEGDTVLYSRAGGVIERWAVGPEGVEFSFEFPQRPAGRGDLVVALRLDTSLPSLGPTPEGGWRFGVECGSGIAIGSVLGIGACGTRLPGELNYTGGRLELRLDGDFVDSVAYPLLIDPPVGPVLTMDSTQWADRRPAVAYDAGSQVYLVAWERTISADLAKVYFRRVTAAGALLGPVRTFAGNGVWANPQVANVRGAGMFVIVMEVAHAFATPEYSISAGTVLAAEASVTTFEPNLCRFVVSSSPLRNPDVAGLGVSGGVPHFLVVWQDTGNNDIRAQRLEVDATGFPQFPNPSFTIVANTLTATHSEPRISSSTGPSQRYLVVWRTSVFLPSSSTSLRGRLVRLNGTFDGPAQTLVSLSGEQVGRPALDGFENRWLVAFERWGSSGNKGISALRVDAAGGAGTLSPGPLVELAPAGSLSQNQHPEVAWNPTKSWVTWIQSIPLVGANLRLVGLDSATCTICEGPSAAISLSGSSNSFAAVATPTSGGVLSGTGGLLAWSENDGSLPKVFAKRLVLTSGGGSVQNLGGGCGSGGSASLGGVPSIGAPSLNFALSGLPLQPSFAVLNLSPAVVPFTCGPCAWIPFATTFNVNVPPLGFTSLSLPVPCLPGLVGGMLDAQWTVFTPGAAPCDLGPDLSLSNRLRLTFGL